MDVRTKNARISLLRGAGSGFSPVDGATRPEQLDALVVRALLILVDGDFQGRGLVLGLRIYIGARIH